MSMWPNIAIYAIVNTVNRKRYIGSSTDIKARHHAHFMSLSKGSHSNKHLQAAYNKYGKDAFEFVILEKLPLDYELIIHQENYWIAFYNSISEGYNVFWASLGNDEAKRQAISKTLLGRKLPQEIKDKISESLKGRSRPQEVKDKIRASTLGRVGSRLGHKSSELHKSRISEAHQKRRQEVVRLTQELIDRGY